ncbi:MAG: SigB/SigF/SigG family RNA polymerase sigma factor [Acidimicrobiia bacterium]|nr:SigB/SigF/SigG family RNA polymerase sigma factor [Acidimicrobiia bacterium]
MVDRREPDGAATDFDRFRESARTGDLELRDALVEDHLHLADHFIRRYRNRSVAEEDLRQIAHLAILRAVERFDPEKGFTFSTFASRTIDGELKRFFRDRSWAVRPPRRAQELHLEVRAAEEHLTQERGRAPTVAELSAHLGFDEDDILEGLEAGSAYHSTSLDQPRPGQTDDAPTTGDALGSVDEGFDQAENRLLTEELLEGLPDRERSILRMRFAEGLSQPEIAERIGVSQSYLSRLLRRTLVELRPRIEDVGGEAGY